MEQLALASVVALAEPTIEAINFLATKVQPLVCLTKDQLIELFNQNPKAIEEAVTWIKNTPQGLNKFLGYIKNHSKEIGAVTSSLSFTASICRLISQKKKLKDVMKDMASLKIDIENLKLSIYSNQTKINNKIDGLEKEKADKTELKEIEKKIDGLVISVIPSVIPDDKKLVGIKKDIKKLQEFKQLFMEVYADNNQMQKSFRLLLGLPRLVLENDKRSRENRKLILELKPHQPITPAILNKINNNDKRSKKNRTRVKILEQKIDILDKRYQIFSVNFNDFMKLLKWLERFNRIDREIKKIKEDRNTFIGSQTSEKMTTSGVMGGVGYFATKRLLQAGLTTMSGPLGWMCNAAWMYGTMVSGLATVAGGVNGTGAIYDRYMASSATGMYGRPSNLSDFDGSSCKIKVDKYNSGFYQTCVNPLYTKKNIKQSIENWIKSDIQKEFDLDLTKIYDNNYLYTKSNEIEKKYNTLKNTREAVNVNIPIPAPAPVPC